MEKWTPNELGNVGRVAQRPLSRHFPNDIQLRGNCTTVPPPRELYWVHILVNNLKGRIGVTQAVQRPFVAVPKHRIANHFSINLTMRYIEVTDEQLKGAVERV